MSRASKWPVTPLGEACKIIAGQSPSSTTYNSTGIGLPFFQGKADFGQITPHIRSYCSDPIKIAEPGDILISVRAPVGPTNLCDVKSCIGRGLSAIRATPKVDTKYVFHFLRFHEPIIAQSGVGSTFQAITQDDLKSIPLPLPSFSEQKRIAAILDSADTIRQKRKAAIAKLDELSQSVFLEMFGDPLKNEKGWKEALLCDVCEKITDGTHFSPPIVEKGVPYITAKHLKTTGLAFESDPWFISEENHNKIFKRCDPRIGDVLYIKDGATTGIAAINRYLFEFSMLSSLALLRPDNLRCTAEYLCCWLNNTAVKSQVLLDMAGGAIKRLTLSKIQAIKILVPPIELQEQFAKYHSTLFHARQKLESCLEKEEALYLSLQHRAFAGEL